jgi:radical SAM protein with 4Fe4S-binding SPASM domain
LTPIQRTRAMQVLTRLAERYDQRIQAQAGPLILARELKTMDEMIASGQTGRPGRGTLSACGGMFSQMAVMHDGTIVPCHVLSTLALGKIGIDSFSEIWRIHPTMLALRNRHTIPLSLLKSCQDCCYQGFCAGGCPGGAVHFSGDFNMRNPMDCYRVLRGEDPFVCIIDPTNELSEGVLDG